MLKINYLQKYLQTKAVAMYKHEMIYNLQSILWYIFTTKTMNNFLVNYMVIIGN